MTAVTAVLPILRYRGIDRHGTARTGAVRRRAADLTEACYTAGWRWLVVTNKGRTVARIDHHPDTGARTWWAEA